MRPAIVQFSALFSLAAPAAAQVTESPVPFDTAGRILSVNPPLAGRLGLTPPAWPVTGSFIEARLYRMSTGGFSLTVTRSGGAIDRYGLDSAQASTLRSAFADGVARAGRIVAEDAASVVAEPARGPFVRDQMLLASVIYGPALASLTNDGATGTGLYMLSVGGTFFAINQFARGRMITRSQNALATDGALRGWAATGLATTMLNAKLSQDGAAITALVGGIGGSMVGYARGRNLTNSEAQAAMTVSTLAAGTVLGATATLGGVESDKASSAALLAGGIAGYVAGPAYPRRAGYTVTAGDVQLVRLGAALGTLAAITPFIEADNLDPKAAAGIATVGWVGGALLTDHLAVRPFNHTEGDARMIHLGALGGAVIGLALPIMARSENAFPYMAGISAGGIVGAIATQGMIAPARAGSTYRGPEVSGAHLSFDSDGLLMSAARVPGRHSILSLRF
jgi:hypothetical protein